jgi:ribosome-binding protein aMBF1 (putative translation factor)
VKIKVDANGDWIYPGDEVVLKALGATVQKLRLDAGLSLEEASKRADAAEKVMDKDLIRRSVGLAIRNARLRAGMDRHTLSKKSGVPLKTLIQVERHQTNVGFIEFVRISFALKILPHVLTQEQEQIERNIREGRL